MMTPPLRVLGLHGYDSSGPILASQLQPLGRALCGGSWELHCPNAPHRLASSRHAWFRATDPVGPVQYIGVGESPALLDQLVASASRPFDLVIGFSQGCTMALMWQHSAAVPAHRRWKSVLYLCPPNPIRDASLAQETTLKDPLSVVAYGTRDTCGALLTRPDTLRMFPSPDNYRLVEYDEPHIPPQHASPVPAALALPLSRRYFAFDFDGVLCHSSRECGMTAWLGCAGLIATCDGRSFPSEKQLEAFCAVRPLLEHGFEALILWYRLESLGETAEAMLSSPEPAAAMEAARARMPTSPTVDDLKARFKQARQMWIDRDEEGWFAANEFYAPVVDCVRTLVARKETVYIITTKSKEFARRLIDRIGLGALDDEHVFGLSPLTKSEIISRLAHNVEAKLGGGVCVFVEDRVDTLVHVAKTARAPVELHLAGHGYNTDLHKAAAAAHGFIVHASASDLASFMLTR